ncbi:MAG TPA: acyl-CoA dehydrogenase family protein [Spongiibacteraceae bacterium]|nr:acyl-CoA dehydrogenase family protein [Spongiibacteraceae bacterium]
MANRIELTESAQQLIDRAHALAPLLRERAASDAQQRQVSAETIQALRDAGLFRVLQPRRWGGFEMEPGAFAEIQIALAAGDMSAAWVYGVVGVHPFQLALFDDRAAQDVWGVDNSTLIASTYMPTGRATPVDGGFRFSGKWKFSSGSAHCEWVLLGGLVGDPQRGDYRTFLLPRTDYSIVDTWHVLGLKGTGSQDIVVEDVFVPDYRVHDLGAAYKGKSPGQSVNDGWLYRLSFPLVFGRAVSNGCIGALQALLDAFRNYGAKRIGTTGAPTARDPDAQLACAEAVVAIDEMTATLHRNFVRMEYYARRGEETPIELRLQFKYQSAAVADRCVDSAAKIFKCVGGSGLFETYPFGRIYADLIAARQHVSNQSQVSGRNFGATLLGLENPDPQI